MSQNNRPSTPKPMWVKLGLWGLPNRNTAMFFVWLSVGLSTFLIISGQYPFGIGAAMAAVWYWKAIDWVDRFDKW